MALYVVKENQELLWNVINKNKSINEYFQYNIEKKVDWFKDIIRIFYEKNKLQNISVQDLNKINKETITYMISTIKNHPTQNQQIETSVKPIDQYQQVGSMISTPPIVPDTRQEIYAQQYEQRQEEYQKMTKRTVPENVDFAEKIEDGVINNMDELVKQQMKQREYELQNIPPPTKPVTDTVIANVPKLKIDPQTNINISVEEVQDKGQKSVSWKDDMNTSDIDLLKNQVQNLKDIINKMNNKLEKLEITIHTNKVMDEIINKIDNK